MFNNSGSKLKLLAKVFFWIAIISSLFSGIAVIGVDAKSGVIILVLGFVFAYVGNLTLYAFGELVENTAVAARNLKELNSKKDI